ncbi:MAG: Do family serine endopeptidase [bacterium]
MTLRKRIIPVLVTLLLGFTGIMVSVLTAGAGTNKEYTGPRFNGERPERALNILGDIETGLNYTAEKTRPAVVTVFVQKKVERPGKFPFRFRIPRTPQRKRKARGLGSGVIIRSNGYIVTNHHVVKDVNNIQVLLANQEKVEATLVGADPRTDLAVLKIDRTSLPELDFADSSKLDVGQWAIAVGSPFSLKDSVSYGHVSALKRSIQATQYENFVQTDAPINRGNSGGPLVDIHGDIIGINTVIQSTSGGSQGVGFASASNLVQRTVTDIIKHGKVKRAWLGVTIQKLSADAMKQHFGQEQGALVSDVRQGAPADTAGLKAGDLVTKLNGQAILGPTDLQQAVIAHNPGKEVTLSIIRNGKQKTVSLTLGERPTLKKTETSGPEGSNLLAKLGLGVREIKPARARKLGLDVDHPLVQVVKLGRGSPAHKAGLRPKDIIRSVNRKAVKSVESFRTKLRQASKKGKDSVLMSVQRKDRRLFVTVPFPDTEG